MSWGRDEILGRFPEPPGSVRKALELLEVLGRGDADEIAGRELGDLPRPWNPSTCTGELRSAIWAWCDDVVDWINVEYAWMSALAIPDCWPRHPHIAHELPVLACQRWAAEESTSYEALDDWHRYALPMFYERMFARIGRSCSAEHKSWPALTSVSSYRTQDSVDSRKAVFNRDSHAPYQTLQGRHDGIASLGD